MLQDEAGAIAANVAAGSPTADTLRSFLALTVAILTETEHAFRSIAPIHPTQWESLERSAAVFSDEHVVKWLAENSPDVQRAVNLHRRRRVTAGAGGLQLVESERDQRARWVAVAFPEGTPMPIGADVADDLLEVTMDARTRLDKCLEVDPIDEYIVAGQVVGLLSAAEMLLALLPSNELAAFCVYLALLSASNRR